MKVKPFSRAQSVIWKLRSKGYSYRKISKYLSEHYNINLSHSTVRYSLDPNYRINERHRAWRNRRKPKRDKLKGGRRNYILYR